MMGFAPLNPSYTASDVNPGPIRRRLTRGQQRYRGGDRRRRRRRHRRGPAASRRAGRLSPGRGAAAARRPRVDGQSRPNHCSRSRLRLAAFGRPQSLAGDCRGARPHDRQDAAALDAAFASDRLSRVRAGQLSGRAADVLSTGRRARRGGGGRSRRKLSRAARPLEQPDHRDRNLRERSRARPGIGPRFQPLRRQRRELPGGRGLRDGDRRPRRGRAGRARLPGAAHRSQRAAIARGDGKRRHRRRCRHRRGPEQRARRGEASLHPRPARNDGGGGGPAARAGGQVVPVARRAPTSSTRRAACSAAPTAPQPASITSGPSAGRRSRRISGDRWRQSSRRAARLRSSTSPSPSSLVSSAATSPAGSSRCTSTRGASIRSRAAPTPMRCRARPTAAASSPRRRTSASCSRARPARATISRPRTAPISPASPPPTPSSPGGAKVAKGRSPDEAKRNPGPCRAASLPPLRCSRRVAKIG